MDALVWTGSFLARKMDGVKRCFRQSDPEASGSKRGPTLENGTLIETHRLRFDKTLPTVAALCNLLMEEKGCAEQSLRGPTLGNGTQLAFHHCFS